MILHTSVAARLVTDTANRSMVLEMFALGTSGEADVVLFRQDVTALLTAAQKQRLRDTFVAP